MKKLLIILFFISFNSFTQSNKQWQAQNLATEICYNSQNKHQISTSGAFEMSGAFNSNAAGKNAIDKILSTVGLTNTYTSYSCDGIENAFAATRGGIRYILYDAEFIKLADNNSWNSLSILAHEIGHHVNGHSREGSSQYIHRVINEMGENKYYSMKREQELESDRFSGFVLAKLGATYEEAISWFNNLPDYDDSKETHPTFSKRRIAYKEGFNNANVSSDETKKQYKETASKYAITDINSNNIIEKYFETIGGKEKIKTINSLKMSGTSKMGNYIMNMNILQTKPNKLKFILDIGGYILSKIVFDGEEGYVYSNAKKNPFSEIDKKFMIEKILPFEELGWINKNNTTLAYVYEDEEGTKQYVIKAGENSAAYFDANTGLLSEKIERLDKETGLQPQLGKETQLSSTKYSEYRETKGVMFPTKHTIYMEDGTFADFWINSIEINSIIDDSEFNINDKVNTIDKKTDKFSLFKGLYSGMSSKEAKKEFKDNKGTYQNVEVGLYNWEIKQKNLSFEDDVLVGISFHYNNYFSTSENQTILNNTKLFFENLGYKTFYEDEFWSNSENFDSQWGLVLLSPDNLKVAHIYPKPYFLLGEFLGFSPGLIIYDYSKFGLNLNQLESLSPNKEDSGF